jgi:hypothetical protein
MSPDEMRVTALELLHSIGHGAGLDETLVTSDFTWWGYGVGRLNLEEFKALARTMRPAMPQPPALTIVGTAADDRQRPARYSGSGNRRGRVAGPVAPMRDFALTDT